MKYFVISDIHSFATEMKWVLRQAGFNKKNKNHTLIVCGDIFDRGNETLEVYKYLKSIPKKRCILVKGNHESLYFDLLKRGYPMYHDSTNGTINTFCQIAQRSFITDDDWDEIKTKVKNHEITQWLKSAQWVDYFELGKYIFVHSFIPTQNIFEYESDYNDIDETAPFVNWRTEATAEAWEHARWGNPAKQYYTGYFDHEKVKGKTLVVGHWHTWYFHEVLGGDIGSENRDIYYSDHLIALDGGVQRTWYGDYSAHPNVLVIDDSDFNTCFDQYGSKLTNMETLSNDR